MPSIIIARQETHPEKKAIERKEFRVNFELTKSLCEQHGNRLGLVYT